MNIATELVLKDLREILTGALDDVNVAKGTVGSYLSYMEDEFTEAEINETVEAVFDDDDDDDDDEADE